MFKKRDLYTFTKYEDLISGSSSKEISGDSNKIGFTSYDYEVTKYDEVKLSDFGVTGNSPDPAKKNKDRKFLISCTQKINIFNGNSINLGPKSNPNENPNIYENYPVLINPTLQINDKVDGISSKLLQFSPKTLNTKIQTSSSSGDGNASSTNKSVSSTVGSSTSQTNSYGGSASVGGASGPMGGLSFSASGNYEHSKTSTHDRSNSHGSGASHSESNNSNHGNDMSMKDWGAYSFFNSSNSTMSWVFGQEYPWDVIQCRKLKSNTKGLGSQVPLLIPMAMQFALTDGKNFLYPASQLSMYGLQFITKSLWLITLKGGLHEISLNETIGYFSATHELVKSSKSDSGSQPDLVNVYMDENVKTIFDSTTTPTILDLPIMALDPVGLVHHAAIIGFLPKKFNVQPAVSVASPASQPRPFKITAPTNDLLIRDTTSYPQKCSAGAGFSCSDTSLTANFTTDCTTLNMTLYFKVTDKVSDYTLFLKHWKLSGFTGVELSFIINGDQDNAVNKYVDSSEAEGGENNLMSLQLRNSDFSSVNFHDYLQLGLNSIEITIKTIGGQYVQGSGYEIRAISIEKDG